MKQSVKSEVIFMNVVCQKCSLLQSKQVADKITSLQVKVLAEIFTLLH